MHPKKTKPTQLLAAAGLLAILGLTGAQARAGTFSTDFSKDPTSVLDYGGSLWDGSTTAHTGSAAWIQSGGAGPMGGTTNGPVAGIAGDGYLQLTFASPDCSGSGGTGLSSYLCGGVLFDDFDKGLVVAGFTFDCDLRIGNGNPAPADGFSINYVRNSDPVLAALTAGDTFPDMNNQVSSNGGQFSDNGNSGDVSLMEEGTQTGLSIGFDMWQSGNYNNPPTPPAVGKVAPGLTLDSIGLDIRVDGTVVTTIAMPNGTTQEGSTVAPSATDPLSICTGPYDGTGCASNLFWVHLKVSLDQTGLLNVWWKNTQMLTNFQTTFSPSPGRLLMAARVGGNTANIGVDNVQITTIPSSVFVIGGAVPVSPTAFTQSMSDSGQSVVDTSSVKLSLNGTPITANLTVSKDTNGVTTAKYSNPLVPFPPGVTNTVVVSAKDSLGTTVSKTNTFAGIAFTTIDPATAAKGIDTSKPGFILNIYQVDESDTLGVTHATDVNTGVAVASAERILHGDLGPNTADMTLYKGPNNTFNETNVINYNGAAAGGNVGDWPDDGTVANGVAAPNLPGLPGTAPRDSGVDDFAMQLVTYIQFPAQGAYQLIFASDDGFKMTTAANPLEILNSQTIAVADQNKGVGDVAGWVYISQPGVYPFRTVYFQGGGGVSLEWTAINVDGAKALVNDLTTNVSLKAFAVNNGAEPAAVSFTDPPVGSGRAPTADAPVVFEITDGSTAVSNIKLTLNGATVTPTITKNGKVSKVVYTPAPFLPLQADTFVITFSDGATTYAGTNSFTPITQATVVPASMALKAADVDTTKLGFLIKTWQIAATNNGATSHNQPGNTTAIGEAYVHQTLGWPNIADLTFPSAFNGPDGSFVEILAINYNGGPTDNPGAGGNAGSFPDDGTWGATAPDMPGITNTRTDLPENGVDDYALEIRTVLDLQPGIYVMGVNSDDGFRLMVGDGKEWGTFPVVVGEYSGGRGTDNWGYTRFAVQITKAGLYPFRLVFEEGGGGNSVEWFSVKKPWYADNVQKALVGDTANGGIKAYQYPVASTGPTYVKSFAPGRSSWDGSQSTGRAGQDATVTAVLVDGSTPVDTTTISMTINGAAVTPTANKVAGETTVTYKPATGFAMGSTNDVALTFGDRTVSWRFIVGLPATPTFWIEAADFDFGGGQTKPAASVMPYAGGAYAGLGAVSGTDYSGGYDSDNPFYRYPNTVRTPVSIATDYDRGGGEVTCDYRLGWEGGHWYNYTRTFPAGSYNVYAALSHGDATTSATRIGGNLEDVTGGATTILGAFDGPSTGGWGNNALVPMKDAATTNTLAAITLSGTKTLRFNAGNGDFDFILFAPASTVEKPQFTSIKANADGTLTITWTGGGTLEAAPAVTGPWTDVSGAASPYTFTPTSSMLFGRIKK